VTERTAQTQAWIGKRLQVGDTGSEITPRRQFPQGKCPTPAGIVRTRARLLPVGFPHIVDESVLRELTAEPGFHFASNGGDECDCRVNAQRVYGWLV
jgi:hypothetical protein